MGRRGENIRKRKDGRWEARVVQGKPISGKTNYKYFYGRSYQDVRQKKKYFLTGRRDLPAADALLPSAEIGKGSVLFRDVINEWLASKKTVVKESTYACYSIMAKKHILPVLGELFVKEVNSSRLAAFLDEKKNNGRLGGGMLSDKTISDMKVILMQILRFANTRGLIDTLPECPASTSRQPNVSVFTSPEQKLIEKEAMEEDTPFCLGVLISLYGGIRIGEACGLQWGDFDWKNGTVTIQRTVYRIASAGEDIGAKTKVVIGTPKTDCSIRTIPLPEPVFQYLMQRRRPANCYVMTGTVKYMEPRVCLDRYKRFLRRANIADHTFHTLRHTFATRCVEYGVDVKSLSEIMGHSSVKITLQRYVHPSMEVKKTQINKLPCFIADGQIRGQAEAKIT